MRFGKWSPQENKVHRDRCSHINDQRCIVKFVRTIPYRYSFQYEEVRAG